MIHPGRQWIICWTSLVVMNLTSQCADGRYFRAKISFQPAGSLRNTHRSCPLLIKTYTSRSDSEYFFSIKRSSPSVPSHLLPSNCFNVPANGMFASAGCVVGAIANHCKKPLGEFSYPFMSDLNPSENRGAISFAPSSIGFAPVLTARMVWRSWADISDGVASWLADGADWVAGDIWLFCDFREQPRPAHRIMTIENKPAIRILCLPCMDF